MAANDKTNAGTPDAAAPPAPSSVLPAGRAEFLALGTGLAIRQYIIEEAIGAGGFGITYRARHERLKSKVFALKEYFPREYANRSGTRVLSAPGGEGIFHWGLDRFLKEAEALAKCSHPGIVDVVDYFEENGTAYAVLGYVEGQQLGQWLDGLGHPPLQDEIDKILGPILDALQAVHAAKLLHLDIAPDNILIRRDGTPCLIDFGACREDIRGRSGKVSAIVKHGYSPPEQYHGLAELQGPWTDIYALGATLYRAVSGAPPMDSARRGALGDRLQPMSEMARAEYRTRFLDAIDQAMALKPEARPQSVGEWRSLLLDADDMVAPAAVPDARQPASPNPAPASKIADKGAAAPVSGPSAPSRKPLLLTAFALALLGGMTAFAVWRAPEPAPPTANPKVLPTPPVSAPSPAKPPPATPVPATTTIAPPPPPPIAVPSQTNPASSAGANIQTSLDQAFSACQTATDALKNSACSIVIDGTDTPARRARALHLRGVAARKLGNLDRSLADLTASLALVPGLADVLTDRGIAHFLKGDGTQAIADYSEAVRLHPDHADALNNRAWAVFRAGRASDALPDANRAAEVAPDKAYVFDTRGHILEALGRRDDAIRDYERAVTLDANQEDSRAALARLRVRR